MIKVYQSISESIWFTVSASFPSACVVALLVFFSYMGIRLVSRCQKGVTVKLQDIDHIIWQGIWLSLFAYYTYMVFYRTLIARPRWEEPLEKIFGSWGLYSEKGEFTTEAIENGMLLLPFTWLWGIVLRERWSVQPVSIVLRRLTIYGFLMSLFIETVQVVWNRGTLQFSDLFYNTLGGMLGGLLFVTGRWLTRKYGRRSKQE